MFLLTLTSWISFDYLWFFKISVENGPFPDDFPTKFLQFYHGFCCVKSPDGSIANFEDSTHLQLGREPRAERDSHANLRPRHVAGLSSTSVPGTITVLPKPGIIVNLGETIIK